ncbi:MAG: PEP/pyruvate-binding domain-containing protein [Promethearchaeota archaeon]
MDISLSTGIEALDKVIKGVKPGDNLIYQVNSVKDYIPFVHSFCYDANKHKRKLIYFRFAKHQSLLPRHINAEIFHINPEAGFESFIGEIIKVIEQFGLGVCYVFDCLSELSEYWYSDWMLGNFFLLICPYLYQLKTGTYFGIIRNQHSTQTMNAIHQTAQIVFDVFRKNNDIYLLPLKVWQRYSKTMYMLHHWIGDEFKPVMNSAIISEILDKQAKTKVDFTSQIQDFWSRTFNRAQHLFELPFHQKNQKEVANSYKNLIRMLITRDPELIKLAEKYLSLGDVINIGRRMIGTGLIGGKSVGMLIAQAILKNNNPEKFNNLLEIQDCFFIGSDVFYTYLVINQIWWERRSIKSTCNDLERDFIKIGRSLQEKIMEGKFPEEIIFQFKKILEYFGQSPIIIRSSSLLEDAYHNSFSGKYDSFFLPNQSTPEERLENFIEAIKKVYASTMSERALSYCEKRNLLDKDEQMSILIMRVSGSFYGDLFYPQTAGVAYSFNPLVWNEKIESTAGMIRLVFGLGTRAVNIIDDDYTRIVALNEPKLIPVVSSSDYRKYSQKKVDILDLKNNLLVTKSFEDVVKDNKELPLDIFASIDPEVQKFYESRGASNFFAYTLTFNKMLNSNFVNDMREILKILQKAYNNPVDVEFTANFNSEEDYKINILQCRPFQFKSTIKSIKTPKHIEEENLIFETSGPIIGESIATFIDRLIYVVPEVYGKMKMANRYSVARLIGKLNKIHQKQDKIIMIISPGRLGTTSPSLGVTTKFAEMNNLSIVCEVAEMHEGLVPAVSLGTHFFNDLVENNMLYLAIDSRKNDKINKKLLLSAENLLSKLINDAEKFENVLKFIDMSKLSDNKKVRLDSDTFKQKAYCYLQ